MYRSSDALVAKEEGDDEEEKPRGGAAGYPLRLREKPRPPPSIESLRSVKKPPRAAAASFWQQPWLYCRKAQRALL
jgi:hypothetical protein